MQDSNYQMTLKSIFISDFYSPPQKSGWVLYFTLRTDLSVRPSIHPTVRLSIRQRFVSGL